MKCKTCAYEKIKDKNLECMTDESIDGKCPFHVPKIIKSKIIWKSCYDSLPEDSWSDPIKSQYSDEKLVANSAAISLAFYDKEKRGWFTGSPANNEGEIDKIRYWADLPINPMIIK